MLRTESTRPTRRARLHGRRLAAGVAALVVVPVAVSACSAESAPIPVLHDDARSTVEVKREINGSVTDVVGALTDHEADAERTLEVGTDFGPCGDGGRGDRVGYDFGAVWLASPEYARDWATLEPRVERAAQEHGYALAEERPAPDAERTLVFRNDAEDTVRVDVTPEGVGTSADSGCFPPAD